MPVEPVLGLEVRSNMEPSEWWRTWSGRLRKPSKETTLLCRSAVERYR